MNYTEAKDWLFGVQEFGIKLGLEGSCRLLEKFAPRPSDVGKVIHVAGTNGKGSTCAMMDSIGRCAGVKTGLFTSPHLMDYRERMRVSGEMIGEVRCAELLTEMRYLCSTLETHPTFFEISLAIAMRWFYESGCEWIILETGMGGRLDATTAVLANVCVITPIGMDHTQWLGETLGAIAFEKAGIFLPGVPVFSAEQKPEVKMVLAQVAKEKNCKLSFVEKPLTNYSVALQGAHQKENAALAVAAVKSLGLALTPEMIADGLAQVSWPGRFDLYDWNGVEVVLDGAHNPHAAEVLRDTWLETYSLNHGTLIFGAVDSKDVEGMLKIIEGLNTRVFLCRVGTDRGIDTEELRKFYPKDREIPCFNSLEAAMREARSHKETILVTGSLYLVGETRALLTGENFQPSLQ